MWKKKKKKLAPSTEWGHTCPLIALCEINTHNEIWRLQTCACKGFSNLWGKIECKSESNYCQFLCITNLLRISYFKGNCNIITWLEFSVPHKSIRTSQNLLSWNQRKEYLNQNKYSIISKAKLAPPWSSTFIPFYILMSREIIMKCLTQK